MRCGEQSNHQQACSLPAARAPQRATKPRVQWGQCDSLMYWRIWKAAEPLWGRRNNVWSDFKKITQLVCQKLQHWHNKPLPWKGSCTDYRHESEALDDLSPCWGYFFKSVRLHLAQIHFQMWRICPHSTQCVLHATHIHSFFSLSSDTPHFNIEV